MIIEYQPKAINVRGNRVFSGRGKDNRMWRVTLRPGLNDLSDELVDRLKVFPGLAKYVELGAITIREKTQETKFARTSELESLYESQGYTAIAAIATKHGIKKPETGWKDAIPKIVDYEVERS